MLRAGAKAVAFAALRQPEPFGFSLQVQTPFFNAHRINAGDMPYLKSGPNQSDFFFIERGAPEQALETILHLVTERIDNAGIRTAMTNSFGFGGTNACLAVGKLES